MTLYVARDPVGVIPLYTVERGNEVWISTELKAILDIGTPEIVEPGYVYSYGQDAAVPRVRLKYALDYPILPPLERYQEGKYINFWTTLYPSVSIRTSHGVSF